MVMHNNELCEENEIVEGEYARPLNLSKDISIKFTLIFSLLFSQFSTSYQTGRYKYMIYTNFYERLTLIRLAYYIFFKIL